jgi:hypothetical protein
MRTIKNIIQFLVLLLVVTGCKPELNDDISFLNSATVPGKLSALFEITQDNTGNVTITPNGEGAVSFDVYYGDATTVPAKILAGKNTTHKYAEGVYTVKVIGYNITGKATEATQQLTVSFRAPANLEVTADVDVANNFKVNVSAKALYETMFRVYFGDVPNEVPVSFLEGETISHTYATVGTYTVRVVALSGGAATTQFTKDITIVDPVLLPLTFESASLVYNFSNFGGGNVTVINNPNKTGINTSNKVGRMVKSAPEVWGGSVITLGAPINFSANKVFRMKVYSPRVGAKVLLKVENATNSGINFEKETATTVANAWEDLVFDYNAINTGNSYQKVVLIFELGTVGDGTANFTFLFDDIRLTNTIPSAQIDLPVTFDAAGTNYTMTDFGGNNTADGVDPGNNANKIKVTTKGNGAETWAGTTIGTPVGFANKIPFVAGATKMSMRVYSPAVGIPVRLKVEDHLDATKSVETQVPTTIANAWETLLFDFSNNVSGTPLINLATNYDKASVFFDFGTAGTGKVFMWDDVKFEPASSGSTMILDFESASPYNITNFDGGNLTVISNPHSGGINTSAKVAQMVKGAGQQWGGSFVTLDNVIDFSVKKTFKMKVYSPRVGAKVLLKVENLSNSALNFEKEALTTVANGWEELTFDYSAINTANTYQKVVLIFDLGTVGDGTANFTFLLDDIRLQ